MKRDPHASRFEMREGDVRIVRRRAVHMGDFPGHPFRGNQHRGGDSVPRDDRGMLVSPTGEPLRLYHGTVDPTIEATDLDPAAQPVRARSGASGVSFTTDAASAHNYVRRPGAGIKAPRGRVLAAHVTMQHPLDITDAVAAGRKQGLSFGDAKREALKALTPEHDGTVFRGDDFNPDEYQVFSRAQIHAAKKVH